MNQQLHQNVTVIDNAIDVGLPKWPALVVSGDRVTEQQAAEILIRTDDDLPDFTFAGNDSTLSRQLNELFGVPHFSIREDPSTARLMFEKKEKFRRLIGKLDLEFLSNEQIVSSFIGGPHGWCDWDGNIFCNSYNIGKWPDAEQVANEWAEIASAFPFLRLESQLFSGEQCEDATEPVVQFDVADGQVTVTKPERQLVPPVNSVQSDLTAIMLGMKREQGIPVDTLREKIEQVYGRVPQIDEVGENDED